MDLNQANVNDIGRNGPVEGPCCAKSGMTECHHDFGHAGMHSGVLDLGGNLIEVSWAGGWDNEAMLPLLHILPSYHDRWLPPIHALSVTEDGEPHLEWFRS